MKKKILLATALVLLASGCKDVKLENGENAVVTFKDGGISAQELYSEMKETYGASTLIDMIDTKLLEIVYDETKEEKEYIKQQVKNAKKAAESYNVDLATYLTYFYGVSTEKAFEKYLTLEYRRNEYAKAYAKENVTDKEVNEYYEQEIFGDIEASQILISIDTDKDDEDSLDKAKEEAKKTAEEVISKLKKGEDFAELAKKYSKDTTTAANGGSLGFVNKDNANKEVLNALRSLKNGTYSTKPIESENGYYIVYRTSQKEKPELTDELTNTIKTTISEETASDSSYVLKAAKALREKYDMSFVDTDLEKSFTEYVDKQTK